MGLGGIINTLKSVAPPAADTKLAPLTVSQSPKSKEQPLKIEFKTIIHTSGDPEDLDEKLKANNEKLMQMFKEFLRRQQEDKERMVYA
jgi:hypothetical protein